MMLITVGGYWTHYSRQGWYVDAILQGTWYDIKADSDRPFSLSTNGVRLGASLEAGYPFPLASGWIVEPQAQLAYQPGARGSIVGRRDERLIGDCSRRMKSIRDCIRAD
jgi:outer membrane autotransporter protein